MNLELINLLLDFALIGLGFWIIVIVRKLKPAEKTVFSIMAWAAVLLGFAHILETFLFAFFHPDLMDEDFIELLHRLVVLAGMILLALGFERLLAQKQESQS